MDDAGKIFRGLSQLSQLPIAAALMCTMSCSGSEQAGGSAPVRTSSNPAAAGAPATRAAAGSGSGSLVNPNLTAAAGRASPSTGTGTPGVGSGTPPAVGAAGGAAVPPTTPRPGAMGAPAAPPTGAAPPAATPPAAGGATDVPMVAKTPHGKNCLQPGNGNYTSPGPYKVAKKNIDLGMITASQHTGKFTIYSPEPLDANCLHPIVAWGNGTGVTDSDFTYDFLNSNAASWGMVVAASSEDNTGSGEFHKAGINYLLKQNEDMSSPFYKKLATRAGVSGHSQGGFGANLGAAHPNVEAAVVEGASMTATAKVAALVLTGTMDLGAGAADAVKAAAGPMFVGVWEGGNHVGTETVLGYLGLDSTSGDAMVSQRGSQQFQRLYAAWFRCYLADDDVACKLFAGQAPDACGICKEPGWNRLANKNL